MRIIRLIFSDFVGLWRTCGWAVALRWLGAILVHLPECRRVGNLSPADRIFGDGPFQVRRNGRKAWVAGPCVLTGVREVWVRDSYLSGDFLSIPDNGIFLDLGAGSGGFTVLALMSAKNVRGVALEAEADRCIQLKEVLKLNNCSERVKVINAFVGGSTSYGRQIMGAASNQGVPTLSQAELLSEIGLSRIDFLKCDIEGSEFDLLGPDSPLLAITQQIAIEVHPISGNADLLIAGIKSAGFEVHVHHQGPTILLFGRRGNTEATTADARKSFL